MKEILRRNFIRGIDDSCPVSLIITEVVTKEGDLKEPKEKRLLTPVEVLEMGGNEEFEVCFEVEPEDLVFEIQIGGPYSGEESDKLFLVQRPKKYTKNMIEAVENIMFFYGWPYPHRKALGIREVAPGPGKKDG